MEGSSQDTEMYVLASQARDHAPHKVWLTASAGKITWMLILKFYKRLTSLKVLLTHHRSIDNYFFLVTVYKRIFGKKFKLVQQLCYYVMSLLTLQT